VMAASTTALRHRFPHSFNLIFTLIWHRATRKLRNPNLSLGLNAYAVRPR